MVHLERAVTFAIKVAHVEEASSTYYPGLATP